MRYGRRVNAGFYKKKKSKDPLSSLGATALGLGKLGVTVGVSAAVAGKAAAGTAATGAMGGFETIASGAGIAVPVVVGGGLLTQVKGLNKKSKRRKR